jgi:hypothetical protein
MALQDSFDDPGVLERVHARDFEADHAFDDGSTGPALRVAGASGGETWHRLDDRAGAALRSYVEVLGPRSGRYLFATDDVFDGEPPSAGGPPGR